MYKSYRRLFSISGGVIVCGLAFEEYNKPVVEEYRRYLNRTVKSSYRIVNLVSTVSLIAVDYWFYFALKKSGSKDDKNNEKLKLLQQQLEEFTINQLNASNNLDAELWREKIEQTRLDLDRTTESIASSQNQDSGISLLHSRNALRLRNMCANNRGVYIKLGQHISMLDHIVPPEYQTTLSSLLADNPHSAWESVRQTFKEALGHYPDELFLGGIDSKPFASASLAQVHIAYDGHGTKYAVKVQHDGLFEGSRGDMAVITILVKLLSILFKDFNYEWLTKEMNKNLPLELDFRHEHENIKQCTALLADMIKKGDVVVPTVIDNLSSHKILTMKFEEGCFVHDKQKIKELNLNTSQISHLISTTFCEQIFRHGFVHCDPHEANLLIRPHPKYPNKPQLVLLDHGLYRELNDNFRRDYCRLWQSILLSDEKEIKYYCKNLNAEAVYTLLAAVLTCKPWDDIMSEDLDRLKSSNSTSEAVMLRAYAMKYFKEINIMLRTVPSELLLLLKTNDCLRHLDKKLGSPINTLA
eukprot:gene12446-16692_t